MDTGGHRTAECHGCDLEPSSAATEPATVETSQANEPNDRLRALWIVANDTDAPDWPPFWLQCAALASSAVLGVVLVAALWPALVAFYNAGAWLVSTRIGDAVVHPVHVYIEKRSVGYTIPASRLWTIWVGSGLVFLALSTFGARGARVGWLAHGTLTTVMIWQGSASGDAELSVGVYVLAWAALSVVAFRRTHDTPRTLWPRHRRYYQSSTLSRNRLARLFLGPSKYETTPSRHERDQESTARYKAAVAEGSRLQRYADEAAKNVGSLNVTEYVKANWGRGRQAMANELGLPDWYFENLLEAVFPPKAGKTVGRTPWQIREEAVNYVRAGEKYAAVGRRYKMQGSTIARWVKEQDSGLESDETPEVELGLTAQDIEPDPMN